MPAALELPAPVKPIACWSFDHTLEGKEPAMPPLRWSDGEPTWVADGVWGDWGLRIEPGAYAYIPRAELGALNVCGPDARVTVVAWVKRSSAQPWQFIAGVWDETRAKRQYGLFLNAARYTDQPTLQRHPCADRLHGHISDVGGPTAGDVCCLTYATGRTPLPLDAWLMLALTYDGSAIRVYVNGELDTWEGANPFYLGGGIFDGGEGGADFTIGSNSVAGHMGNAFDGVLGGLAVFDRTLAESDLQRLHASARPA